MKKISGLLTESLDVDESAAGTFTEIEVDVPTAAREGIGIAIVGVDIISDHLRDLGTDIVGDVALSESSKTAMPEMDDEDVIAFKRVIQREAAANGWITLSMQEGGYAKHRVDDVDLAHVFIGNKLYALVDSANTGVVYTADMRINYFIVKLNADEIRDLALAEAYE